MGITVLGIGNLVRQDEGVGIHILHGLEDKVPPEIELIDGGTMGFSLLSIVEDTDSLIILDAVDDGRPPGEIAVWHGDDEVPYFFASKMSVHQVSFAEVLNLAKMRGTYPARIAVVGIQPHTLDWGTELSDTVQQALPRAVECVQEIIGTWLP